MDKINYPENVITGEMSDNEVITRVLNGEKNLYAIIVRRYNARLYRIGMSIINHDTEVEDVMQVTYLKAYENLGSFAFKASFSTWLTRILINESILKLKKRKHSFDLNRDMLENVIYQHQIIDVQTPVARMLNAELKVILEEAIRQLPEKYRTVFVMREIENMNVAETKACLNISEVNVKVRLNRAKTLLKNSLSAVYNKDDIFHFHLSRCNQMAEAVLKQMEAL